MLALELDKAAVKGFMGRLLREDLFDGYEMRAVEITAATRISIDGALESAAEATADTAGVKKGGFITWGAVRPLVYEIIKHCSKPKHMKIIFAQREAREVHDNAAALFLNLVYENDDLTFTTATAQRAFVLDKTLDAAWDERVRAFFAKTGLPVKDRE